MSMIERGLEFRSIRAGLEAVFSTPVSLPEIECHTTGAAREALGSLRRFVEDGLKTAQGAVNQDFGKGEIEKVAQLGVALAVRQTIEQSFTLFREILSNEPGRIFAALKKSWEEIYSDKSNDQLFSEKVLQGALMAARGVPEELIRGEMQNVPGLHDSALVCSGLLDGTATGSCYAPVVSAFGLVRNSASIAGHVVDFVNSSERPVLLVGRKGCPAIVQSPWCSSKHLELVIREGALQLDHLNSACGTDVAKRDGVLVSVPKNETTTLFVGDMVIIAPLRDQSNELRMAAAIFMIVPGGRFKSHHEVVIKAKQTAPSSLDLGLLGRAIESRLHFMTRIGTNASALVVGPAGSEINGRAPECNYNELTGAVSFEYNRDRQCWAVYAKRYSGSEIMAVNINGCAVDLNQSSLIATELKTGDQVLVPTRSGDYLSIYLPIHNM